MAAGELIIDKLQLGNSATATQNFFLEVPDVPDGTVTLYRGNVGTLSTPILSVDSAGAVSFAGDVATSATTAVAFAGATTLLTLGGTGATSVLAIPGTLEWSGTTGALTVAGGVYIAKKLKVVGDATFTNLAGTLSTAAQPNVTSLGTLTAVNTSGAITSTLASGALLINTSGTTNGQYIRMVNTTGDAIFGVESSAGGALVTGGLPYNTIVASSATKSVQIVNGATTTGIFSSTGLAVTGTLTATSNYDSAGNMSINTGTATTAGGASGQGLFFGSAFVSINWGSGAPTISATRGSLYLRTDNGANTSLYINRDGGTTWAAVTSN